MRQLKLICLLTIFNFTSFAQPSQQFSSSIIKQKLKKLNVLGSVLYVAAHPDDENTRLISYYANEKLYQTAYLSATRGDGGQNLIGPHLREALGLIRTQELLEARKVDGGQQFFSRANDFGYSKHPDETFEIWDKEKILADFVWVIRKFRPDIIVTRFSEEPGVTHGHHTASALLAKDAFELAADPDAFPDQLNSVKPWQAKRLLWNTSPWFYRITRREWLKDGLVRVDVGSYNSLLGKSYTEIAAESRSMHKSQGFGSTGSRGTQIEYLKHLYGEKPDDTSYGSEFEGIDVTWGRVKNSKKLQQTLKNAYHSFDPENPAATVDILLTALEELDNLEDEHWKSIKRQEIKEVIQACLGLFAEARTKAINMVRKDKYQVELEVVNRSAVPITLIEYSFSGDSEIRSLKTELQNNEVLIEKFNFSVPQSAAFSQPYWLEQKGELGYYRVNDQWLIGKPENDPAYTLSITFERNGRQWSMKVPLVHKSNDRVDGAVYKDIKIVPDISVSFRNDILIFSNSKAKSVFVDVKSFKDNIGGKLSLSLPTTWKSEPDFHHVNFEVNGEEKGFEFVVTPGKGDWNGAIEARLKTANSIIYDQSVQELDYEHISNQIIIKTSSAKAVNFDIKKHGTSIGYIQGAGDLVPEAIREMGYDVELIAPETLTLESLKTYDAVVLGIRAFNTVPELKYKNKELFQYTEEGGTVIVQYNTNRGLVTDQLAPFDLRISRDRVTMENAEVRILQPKHNVMTTPNKISKNDFANWIQERGLYFPDKWSDEFQTIISSSDKGEKMLDSGLLVGKHGKGYYIYTSYSWFRELPAGVPGAYKIFANLLSIGKDS